MDNRIDELVHKQFEELAPSFPGLTLCQDVSGCWLIRGLLSFSATYQSVTIADTFSVLITLPEDYPDSPPIVQETGNRIPADFHQYEDRTLCLGAPIEVARRFRSDPRLSSFIGTLVVEYLYGFAYFERYGNLPFGELSHGCTGIREYYMDLFKTKDVRIVLALLKLLADGTYRGHLLCPCNSGEILRRCHGPSLLALLDIQKKKHYFLSESKSILYSLDENDFKDFNLDLLPTRYKRELDELTREKARREKCK